MTSTIFHEYTFISDVQRGQPPVFKVLHNGVEPRTPETLVKYYPLNQFSIDAVTKLQFYIAHPLDLNDPFDCSLHLIDYSSFPLENILKFLCPPYDKNEIIQEYGKNRTLVIQTFQVTLWNLHFRTMGILSLCHNLDSLHLWSYYTGHQGFNLEIETHLPINFIGPIKSIYLPELKRVNGELFKDALNALLFNITVKGTFWETENEWRYFVISQKDMKIPDTRFDIDQNEAIERLIDYPPEVVRSITLAVRFFTVSEYRPDLTKPTQATLTVKDQISCDRSILRQRLLDHIINNKIPAYMMFEELTKDNMLVLNRRQIHIKKEAEGIYMIGLITL